MTERLNESAEGVHVISATRAPGPKLNDVDREELGGAPLRLEDRLSDMGESVWEPSNWVTSI
ncbi:MAG: hypothetical protein O7I42_06085 [Alphaproteobacteria bacterium]|nr:hypothetical protein [Alphaproteobacteria bacterium]